MTTWATDNPQVEILRQLVEEQREMIVRLKADLEFYATAHRRALSEIAQLQIELMKREPVVDFLRRAP